MSSFAGPIHVQSPLNQSLKTSKNYVKKAHVYGDVDRKLLDVGDLKEPYTFIGRLETSDNSTCTASLIHEKFILTAAHCVKGKNEKKFKDSFEFKLGYKRGLYTAKSSATVAAFGSLNLQKDGYENDWAILKLTKALGVKHGYFKLKTIPNIEDNLNYDITQAGYGAAFEGGEALTVHENCNIRKHNNGGTYLETDCEVSKGDSGSPLFKCTEDLGCVIVGLVYGMYQPQNLPALKPDEKALVLKEYSPEFAHVALSPVMFEHELSKLIYYDQQGE